MRSRPLLPRCCPAKLRANAGSHLRAKSFWIALLLSWKSRQLHARPQGTSSQSLEGQLKIETLQIAHHEPSKLPAKSATSCRSNRSSAKISSELIHQAGSSQPSRFPRAPIWQRNLAARYWLRSSRSSSALSQDEAHQHTQAQRRPVDMFLQGMSLLIQVGSRWNNNWVFQKGRNESRCYTPCCRTDRHELVPKFARAPTKLQNIRACIYIYIIYIYIHRIKIYYYIYIYN